MQTPRISRGIGLVLFSFSLSASLPAGAQEGEGLPAGAQEGEGAEVAGSGIAHVSFTSEIIDREPADRLSELTNDSRVIYFHSELLGLDGSEVLHRWEFNGQTMAEVPFRVGADRWRVWSSKRLDPVWLGEWKASVIGTDGRVLASETFRYTASVPAAPAQTAPAAPAKAAVQGADATESDGQ